MKGSGRTIATVALLAAMYALACHGLTPPRPRPANAPVGTFSAERAKAVLQRLLGDQTPHPVGSAANRAVRKRLVAEIERLGLKAEVQRTIGCHARRSRCARVENVVAEIPGQNEDAVAVMAHYDSVPTSPGAADDGAGVAAILETARILLRQPPGRNRVLLVFTDAEEAGLLGAEAFFAEHPSAAKVRAVVNLEGSGSSGPSLLLRTTQDGGHLLNVFRAEALSPVALSLAQEVFERMPNDTDFSVSARAGIPSIDFAFAFAFNHYHTPLDTLENLDLGSLQHHGFNIAPLLEGLRHADLNQTADNFAYLTLHHVLWLAWPTERSIPLAGLGLLMLLITTIRLRRTVRPGSVGVGFGLAVASLVGAVALCWGAMFAADFVAGTTVAFPAHAWSWRLLMMASAWLIAAAFGQWADPRFPFWSLFLGAWWLLGLIALGLAFVAPLASNLLIVPVLFAGILAMVAALLPGRPGVHMWAAIIATGFMAYWMFVVAIANEETQGLRLAPAIYAWFILLGVALLPLRPGRLFVILLAVVGVGTVALISLLPLYSADRPQHVTMAYVLDLQSDRAYWSVYSPNPLPPRIEAALGDERREGPMLPWFKYSTDRAPAPRIDLPPPKFTVDRQGPRVAMTYHGRAGIDFMMLALPESAGLSNLSVAGRPAQVSSRWGYTDITVIGPGSGPLAIEFDMTETASVTAYASEGAFALPAVGADLAAARGTLAVPQHQGDRRFVMTTIAF